MFADGMSQMITPVVGALGGMVSLSADFLDLIPGMGDQADEMRGISDAMLGFSGSLAGAGDTARSLADGLDSMRPGLQAARDGLREGGEAAENTSLLMRALGDSVKMVPDSKDIIISSNSPKRQEELEKLGLTVRELPDGTFQVFANTAEGQRIVDDFVNTNKDRNIDMKIRLHYESLGAQNDRIVAEAAAASAPGGSGYGSKPQHDPVQRQAVAGFSWHRRRRGTHSRVPLLVVVTEKGCRSDRHPCVDTDWTHSPPIWGEQA
ncbi:hypothetical protein D092_22205 [Rhodococcus ruber Chol-4]|nr:hypothetical protein D092_22205 [Rhodococcus ruber Chol-4]